MAASWAATPRILVVGCVGCAVVALAGPGAFADPPRSGVAPASHSRPPAAHPPTHKGTPVTDGGAAVGPAGIGAGASAPSAAGAGGPSFASDAGVVESRTLDGGTRVFKFSELDIEGRLKSPQLVYFLRRVRAEFGAEDLGHRSFLREMSETRKEPSF